MIQTPEALESVFAANHSGAPTSMSWERHARTVTTSLLMLAGGTRSNPAREPVKAAVLRAIQRDARLSDLQRDLEAMPISATIGRALRRVAPHALLQLPVSSEEAETLTRAWAFEAGLEEGGVGEGESSIDARQDERASDPVASFVVSMLLDLTGMQITGADLQFVRRVTSVAVHSSASYDELLETLWSEPSLDEFVMRLRYLSRPASVVSMFGPARSGGAPGPAYNA